MNEEQRAAVRRQAREQFDREHGGIEAPSSGPPSPHDTFGVEQAARREWESSPSIRAEFTQWEAFLAYRRAEARGAVRILGRNRGA
jgi:hypothetical protein